MNADYKLILTAMLSSSVMSVVITAFLKNFESDKTYKKEYFKKIIDKRFNAYEDLEDVLRMLNTRVFDKKLNGAYLYIAQDIETFGTFTVALFKAQMSMRWLGGQSQNALSELCVIFAKVGENIGEEMNEIGLDHAISPYLKQIVNLNRNLHDSSLIDFASLHDVNHFFNSYKRPGF